MSIRKKNLKVVCTVLLFALMFSLTIGGMLPSPTAAETPGTRTIGSLCVGDKVVDRSWEWEHLAGEKYTESGEIKPVTWIVVAKNHYEGMEPHVTLLSDELIGKHPFDNSTNRGSNYGSNNWEKSGTPNATHGLRPFLNSLDKNSYSYTGEGFYAAFSSSFKNAVLTTPLPNKVWEPDDIYVTQDNVFIPSRKELGGTGGTFVHEVGETFEYFQNSSDEDRIALFAGAAEYYWNRSPSTNEMISGVKNDGTLNTTFLADRDHLYIRPAVNVSPDILVYEEKNDEDVYEIVWPTKPLSDMSFGDRVVDLTWQWEHRTGANYTGMGEVKPVTWIVVAKNHYEGMEPHVTLLSEELIGNHTYDNSTNRGSDEGSNHWGNSGTPDATHGLRPFLNSLDKAFYSYEGEGFYAAFSPRFKASLLTTPVENKLWDTGAPYTTQDKVFIPSQTELGDTDHTSTHVVGKVFRYFEGASNIQRRAIFAGSLWYYWNRSPDSRFPDLVRMVGNDGSFSFNSLARQTFFGIRPVVNVRSDLLAVMNDEGIYEIQWPDAVPLGSLRTGDRVLDPSWEWEHKTGDNYTVSGETKPVVWTVVAKNHTGFPANSVTLLSEELIARYTFDNSTYTHHAGPNGSNHWGNSGIHNASHGLRPFLNSLEKTSYSYEGEGFYAAFSSGFKDSVLTTATPNKLWETGSSYSMNDNVFVLSQTELGGGSTGTHQIGTVMEYFDGAENSDRIAKLSGNAVSYWTRSPSYNNGYNVRYVFTTGSFSNALANQSNLGVRPALNLDYETLVSPLPNEQGVYEIMYLDDILYGDINLDENVDVGDAILVLRHIVNLINIEIEYGPGTLNRADVNGDGEVDVGDAILILRYIVGLIEEFPIQQQD